MDCTILRQVAAQKHAHAKRYRRSLLALSRWWVLPLPLLMSYYQQAVHYWVARRIEPAELPFGIHGPQQIKQAGPLGGPRKHMLGGQHLAADRGAFRVSTRP